MPIAGACGVSGVIDGTLHLPSNCSETEAHAFVRYDPATNSWTALTLRAKVHYLPTGGSINERFYLAGGLNCSDGTSSLYVEAYTRWLGLTDMPTARGFLAPASLGGKMYAIGGRNESGLLTTTEAYDPSVRR